MRYARFFLSVFLVLAVTKSQAAAEGTGKRFTVMTYNIRTGLGMYQPGLNPYKARDLDVHNVEPVIAAIRSTGAEIVALQEVLGEKQARQIAKALRMRVAYIRHGVKKPPHGYWWGLAILSRHPILSAERSPISTGRGNTRSNLIARISVHNRPVTFINIHKDKDGTDGDALRRTMASLARRKGPFVLLGDLNIRPGDPRLRILTARFADTATLTKTGGPELLASPTFHKNGKPAKGRHLDYIMAEPSRFVVHRVGLLARRHWLASDHIGVTATISLK